MPKAQDEVNAQFLMQATFGPTRNSLSEFAGITHEEVGAPTDGAALELHRAYDRPRVNPLSSSKEEVARGPCDARSRWSQFVFTLADVARASKSWPPDPSLLYSVQKGHRIGAAAPKNGFRRKFHRFHL